MPKINNLGSYLRQPNLEEMATEIKSKHEVDYTYEKVVRKDGEIEQVTKIEFIDIDGDGKSDIKIGTQQTFKHGAQKDDSFVTVKDEKNNVQHFVEVDETNDRNDMTGVQKIDGKTGVSDGVYQYPNRDGVDSIEVVRHPDFSTELIESSMESAVFARRDENIDMLLGTEIERYGKPSEVVTEGSSVLSLMLHTDGKSYGLKDTNEDGFVDQVETTTVTSRSVRRKTYSDTNRDGNANHLLVEKDK